MFLGETKVCVHNDALNVFIETHTSLLWLAKKCAKETKWDETCSEGNGCAVLNSESVLNRSRQAEPMPSSVQNFLSNLLNTSLQ
jgi:hypothetical protein